MMEYFRINQDDAYLVFNIPSQEVLDKLGRAHPFHIDRSPIPYADLWPTTFNINFLASMGSKTKEIPDISEAGGRLFFSEKAFKKLKDICSNYGEFLPVSFDTGIGYIFNPLITAEQLGGVDKNLIGFDSNANLEHFGFKDSAIRNTPIFRTELDNYHGIFCTSTVKNAIEDAKLKGVKFNVDLVNTISEPYGINH